MIVIVFQEEVDQIVGQDYGLEIYYSFFKLQFGRKKEGERGIVIIRYWIFIFLRKFFYFIFIYKGGGIGKRDCLRFLIKKKQGVREF